ncbi:MAG: winged helix-turn-helix transcriptional regulator [Thermoplasmatota archaeon]
MEATRITGVEWALVLYDDESFATMSTGRQAVLQYNHHHVFMVNLTENSGIPQRAPALEGNRETLPDSITLASDGGSSPISTAQAWGLEQAYSSGDIKLQAIGKGTCVSQLPGFERIREKIFLHDSFCATRDSILVRSTIAADRFVFRNASIIEVHGSLWNCQGHDCFIDSRPHTYTSTPEGTYPRGTSTEFITAQLESIDSVNVTSPREVWMIGSRLEAEFDGALRFPASSKGSCIAEICTSDGESISIKGSGTMSIIATSGHETNTELSGSFSSIRIDERTITGSLAAPTAAAGLLTLGIFLKVLLGLMTHHAAKGNPLEHPRRELLFGYIKENPGATFREVVRGTEVPTGTARHHLSVLRRADIIVSHRHHETLRFFENHGRFEQSWHSVVVLRDPEMARLHAWLGKNPGSFQKEILAAMDEHGWSRSTTQNRLKRLQAEGLVSMRPQGRLKCYSVVDAPSRLGDVAT